VTKTIGWDQRLSVSVNGRGLVGHAGAVLLRKCADKTGLTLALSTVMPSSQAPDWWDRGVTLVGTAVAIVLGAVNLSDVERLWAQQAAVFGAPASDSTIGRTLSAVDEEVLGRIARGRARVRRHVWSLLRLRPGGFPWLVVAGKRLAGWIVIDIDATLITAHSVKDGAAVTFKKTWGFHPLAAWCANTTESLAMLLRPGNSGSNTVADHITVLTDALAQIPGSSAAKILVRVDGAGATHDLLEHLEGLNTARRTVRYTVGWKMTDADEAAIARLAEADWQDSLHQDGTVQPEYAIAELTGLNTRTGWPEGLRLLVRRTRPSRRHLKMLTAFEKKTGWRYQILATNIRHMWGIAGSHQPQWLDVLHRAHAQVEDRVRTNKAMGLRNLPSKSWTTNCGWVLAANLAADLDAWTRLLCLHDSGDLADAEPDTLRYRLWHLPAKLTRHARRRWLKISRGWPWREAFLTCWNRLTALPPAPH
jgi:Transposase DDE domain group 1